MSSIAVSSVWLTALLSWGAAGAAEPTPSPNAPIAEPRVALIIGNSAYMQAPLANPVNDARDMAKVLVALGFRVTLKENAPLAEMKQAIRDFGRAIKQGGVGLFYFAGHGIQAKGRNYLVPVNADIQNEYEIEDQAVDTNLVLGAMDEAQNRVNILILDACRNNPFARSFRSAAGGLAQMDAARGTLIAYATSPGSVAADGSGRNGIYTKHLVESLQQGDSDISKVFSRVRADVVAETHGQQTPWESTSLIGDFYFNPSQYNNARPVSAAAPYVADSPLAVEIAYWESIQTSTDAADYGAYLRRYPEGQFSDIARNRFDQLKTAIAVRDGASGAASSTVPKSTVILYRPRKIVCSGVDSTVLIKGREIGKLPSGGYLSASVPAGDLAVTVEVKGGGVIQRTLDIDPGQTYYARLELLFGCASGGLSVASAEEGEKAIKQLNNVMASSTR